MGGRHRSSFDTCTPDQIAQFKRLADAGASAPRIAQKMKMGLSKVYCMLVDYDIEMQCRDAKKCGYDSVFEEVAKAYPGRLEIRRDTYFLDGKPINSLELLKAYNGWAKKAKCEPLGKVPVDK